VARTWPTLARELGERFASQFAAYAGPSALPEFGGPLADGRAFARWLAQRGQLPAACRSQVFAVDLRFAQTPHGLVRRRWPGIRVAFMRRSLILGLRLPWLGERWLRIPTFFGSG
jgi:hypothetical protein